MGTIVQMADTMMPVNVDPDVMSLMEQLNIAAASGKTFAMVNNSDGDKVMLSIADIRVATETEEF